MAATLCLLLRKMGLRVALGPRCSDTNAGMSPACHGQPSSSRLPHRNTERSRGTFSQPTSQTRRYAQLADSTKGASVPPMPMPMVSHPSLLERAITRVVVDFWGRLRGFAALGLPRKGWAQVGPDSLGPVWVACAVWSGQVPRRP
jgi:hypothetical protein